MDPKLQDERCVACRSGDPPLNDEEIQRFMPQVPDWQVIEVGGEKRLEKTFKFKDFSEALRFTDRIGALAEEQDHHPALLTEWGKVTVTWWTHKIHGLHRNDFVMASKSDAAYSEMKPA
jgi:4a-hydroxytetrahydrobiopterin dehydratase